MSKPDSAGTPFLRAAEAADDVAQLPVGDVDRPPPGDGRDLRLVPVEAVRVDERGEQVVRGRDRVHVAREVEVDVLHRHDLRVAAAGGAALDAEDGAERRLAQRQDRAPADLAEALRQRHRGRRLALAGGRRRDRRHVDQLRVRARRRGDRGSRDRPSPCSGRRARARRARCPTSAATSAIGRMEAACAISRLESMVVPFWRKCRDEASARLDSCQ